jgi:hypothetical protein
MNLNFQDYKSEPNILKYVTNLFLEFGKGGLQMLTRNNYYTSRNFNWMLPYVNPVCYAGYEAIKFVAQTV